MITYLDLFTEVPTETIAVVFIGRMGVTSIVCQTLLRSAVGVIHLELGQVPHILRLLVLLPTEEPSHQGLDLHYFFNLQWSELFRQLSFLHSDYVHLGLRTDIC